MSDGTDPRLRGFLLQLIFGFTASQVIHVAARLELADLLADGPKTTDELAAATDTHPPSLYRLLRGLACVGIVEQGDRGRFKLGQLGELLQGDHPDSVRNLTLLFCGDGVWGNWQHLLDSVRTGRPVHELTGAPAPFEAMGDESEFSDIFNAAMSEGTRQAAPALVGAYDFSSFRSVVDVGGGDGTLLAAILAAAPDLRGVLFDLPAGLQRAYEVLENIGVADRCEIVDGDLFEAVPESADLYVLKSVIHDWDDERASTILANCRQAMAPDGKVLVLEPVLPAKVDASPEILGAVLVGDLNMLVSTGGRERTEEEFATLLDAAGLHLTAVVPLPAPAFLSVIEAVPA